MAVAIIRTDDWVSHLLFTGGPRPTNFGMVDGVFFGLLSGLGIAGAGNFTLNGNISFDRKEDWIYVPQGSAPQGNSETLNADDVFEVINTGPLIPTNSGVSNPSFAFGGSMQGMTQNSLSVPATSQQKAFYGMPVFGDKKIAGSLALYAVGFEDNVDGVTYTASIWGWLIEYASFFRGVSPLR